MASSRVSRATTYSSITQVFRERATNPSRRAERVEFDVVPGRKGEEAQNVRVV